MNRSVSPLHAANRPGEWRAADSSVRTAVVPTATTRPPRSLAGVDRLSGHGRQIAPFVVHDVLCRIVGLQRLKRAETDVQR